MQRRLLRSLAVEHVHLVVPSSSESDMIDVGQGIIGQDCLPSHASDYTACRLARLCWLHNVCMEWLPELPARRKSWSRLMIYCVRCVYWLRWWHFKLLEDTRLDETYDNISPDMTMWHEFLKARCIYYYCNVMQSGTAFMIWIAPSRTTILFTNSGLSMRNLIRLQCGS